MKPLRSILTASLALAVLSHTSLRAETFPVFEDAAGLNTISKSAGAAKTLAISGKSSAFINFAVGSGQGDPTFNIDPATVTAARLIIFLPKGSKTGTLSIRNLTSAFTETIATASIPAPTLGATLDTINLANIPLNGDYYTSDITAQVKAWLTTPASEFGVAITSDGTANAILASKEGAGSGHPAVIEIEVNRGGGTVSGTTAAFTGNVGIGTASAQSPLDVRGGNASGGNPTMIIAGSGGTLTQVINTTNGNNLWDIIASTNSYAISRSGIDNPFAINLATGNVGIGSGSTGSAGAKLEVRGGNQSAGVPTMNMAGPGGVLTKIINSTNSTNLWDVYASTDSYAISRSGVDFPFVINFNTGNVGVGTGVPIVKFEVNGGIKCIGAVDTSSDARYKTNVAPLAGALDKARRLRGVSYDWNRAAFPQKDFGDRHQIGFIAQEVREILPDVVSADHDGYLSIGYTAIIPVLAEAIEELQTQKDAEIAALKQQVAALEARDAAREARVARMERALGESPVRTVRASLDLK